jgi:hypothetical protein
VAEKFFTRPREGREDERTLALERSVRYVSPQSLMGDVGEKTASMRDEKGSAAGCKLVRRRARARRKSWNGEAGFQISRSIGSRRNSAKLGPLKTRDIVCCVFGIRASLIA